MLSSPAKDTTTQPPQLASDVPGDDLAPIALLEAGKAHEDLGDYGSAAKIYDGLVATYRRVTPAWPAPSVVARTSSCCVCA